MTGIMASLAGGPSATLSAVAPPGTASGSDSGFAPTGLVVSNGVIAAGVGGSGTYTFDWTHFSGDAAINVISPTAANTAFSGTVGGTVNAVKRCTVTDTITGLTAIIDVPVDLTWTDLT